MADLTVRTYDPNQVIVTFMGVPITGFAEGTFVDIKPSGDAFTKSRGADGGIDRTNNNVFDYEVALTLKQTSPSNEVLSAALAADRLSNAGTGILVVKDNNGTSLFTAAQAWIRKEPDQPWAEKLGTREWTFDTGVAANLVGGN